MTEPEPIADTADKAPLPDVEEMDLRARVVLLDEQLGAHRSAILLLATGIALLAVLIVLRTRSTA